MSPELYELIINKKYNYDSLDIKKSSIFSIGLLFLRAN